MVAYAIVDVDVHDIVDYLVYQLLLAPLLESAGTSLEVLSVKVVHTV